MEGRIGFIARRDNALRHELTHRTKTNESYVHDFPFHAKRTLADQFSAAVEKNSYFCTSKYRRAAFFPASLSME
jgi:hypothetical protein